MRHDGYLYAEQWGPVWAKDPGKTWAGPGASTVDPQNREAKRLPTECVRRPGCLPRWG